MEMQFLSRRMESQDSFRQTSFSFDLNENCELYLASFMADDLEDGEIPDEEDEVPQNVSSVAQAEDEKTEKSEGGGNTPIASDTLPISVSKEQTKIDDSKVPPSGINEKGSRRSSNEGVDMHSDDDSQRKKRKKKKRHRESDDDEKSRDVKRQKRRHHRKRDDENGERVSTKHPKGDGEEEEDDEEMMFVRGASPHHSKPRGSSSSHRHQHKHGRERHRSPLLQTPDFPAAFPENSQLNSNRTPHRHSNTHRRSRSPHNRPYRRISRSPTAGHEGGQFDDHYESYDSDYERDTPHYRRGVGRMEESRRGMEDRLGARKRRGGRGVVVENSPRGGGRGTGPGKRVRKDKRGGGRGDVSKPRRPERSGSICMFYMQGKCQKGDECPYSHDATPPRKLELCKFYLMDCCAKKDKCLYMHKDFPCKYYHTGMKCFSGDNCKFSHGPLDDCLKAILLKINIPMPDEVENGEVKGKEGGVKREEDDKATGSGEKREEGRMQRGLDVEESWLQKHGSGEEEKDDGDRQDEGRIEDEDEEEDDDEEDDGREGLGGGGKLSIVCDDEDEELKIAEKGGTDGEAEGDDDSLKKESGENTSEASEPDVSGDNEDEEEAQEKEENWYSSDEEAEDRSLTDVLKNLSKQPPSPAEKYGTPSGAAEKTENTSAPNENKLKIDAKVLESISLGDLSKISITPDISKLLSTIREGAAAAGNQSPQTSTASDSDSRPASRDPRRVVPRDPRQRSAASEVPRDPRTKPAMLSPRPQPTPQISFTTASMVSDHGDVDLRQLPEGDVDLRRGTVMPVVSSKRDTDLRSRQFGDTDLRRMPPGGEMGSLPFRPVPPPEPATEIDASINSHPPIPFKLIPVSPRESGSVYAKLPRALLPTPDNLSQNDPRMRKVLRLDEVQEESLPAVVTPTTSAPTTIGSPPPATTTPATPRIDPRRARPNNPPSPPKPVQAPVKDPRSVQTMSEMTPASTFTPDPRLAMRTVVPAESPLLKTPPILPSPHGMFLPNVNMGGVNMQNVNMGNVNTGNMNVGNVNMGNMNVGNVNMGNMMGTSQNVDNVGMMPMNVNSMSGEMPPRMGMVSGEERGGMNRGMGVRGALLMDPVPMEYDEYEEEDGEGGMYQDGGYGNAGMG
ncbi:hypothetical protein J437_LFUL002011, partial [Ladona fulva]